MYRITFASEVSPIPVTVSNILHFETRGGQIYCEVLNRASEQELELLRTFSSFYLQNRDVFFLDAVRMTVEPYV